MTLTIILNGCPCITMKIKNWGKKIEELKLDELNPTLKARVIS